MARVIIYLLRGGNTESGARDFLEIRGSRDTQPHARFLIKQEVVTGLNQADSAKIASIRAEYERADVSKDRGERVRKATAEYFGKQAEDKLNISWWETPESVPLSSAAEELDKSADWLRGLVEGPLTNAGHTAGVAGPVPDTFVGIAANLATQRLTAPLENAALIFEVVGIFVGLATWNLPLVVACAKPLAHDLLGKAFAQTFEQVLEEDKYEDIIWSPGTSAQVSPGMSGEDSQLSQRVTDREELDADRREGIGIVRYSQPERAHLTPKPPTRRGPSLGIGGP